MGRKAGKRKPSEGTKPTQQQSQPQQAQRGRDETPPTAQQPDAGEKADADAGAGAGTTTEPVIHFFESFRPAPDLAALLSARIGWAANSAGLKLPAQEPAASGAERASSSSAAGAQPSTGTAAAATGAASPAPPSSTPVITRSVFPSNLTDVFSPAPLTAKQTKALSATEVDIILMLRSLHDAAPASVGEAQTYSPLRSACHALAELFCELRRQAAPSAPGWTDAPSEAQRQKEREIKEASMGNLLSLLYVVLDLTSHLEEVHGLACAEGTRVGGILVLLAQVAKAYAEDLNHIESTCRLRPARLLEELESTTETRDEQLSRFTDAPGSLDEGEDLILIRLLKSPCGRIFFHRLRGLVQDLRDAGTQQHPGCNTSVMIRLISEILLPGVHEHGYPRAKRGHPAIRPPIKGVNLSIGSKLGSSSPLLPHLQLDYGGKPQEALAVNLVGELASRLTSLPVACRDLVTLWAGIAEEMYAYQVFKTSAVECTGFLLQAESLFDPPVTMDEDADEYTLAYVFALLEHTRIVLETAATESTCKNHQPVSRSNGNADDRLRKEASRAVAEQSARSALHVLDDLKEQCEDMNHRAFRFKARAHMAMGTIGRDATHLENAVARFHRLAAANPTPYVPLSFEPPVVSLAASYSQLAQIYLPIKPTDTKRQDSPELPTFVPADPPDTSQAAGLEKAIRSLRAGRKAIKLLKILAKKNISNFSLQQDYADALHTAYVHFSYVGKSSNPPVGWRNEAVRNLLAAYEVYDSLCQGALLFLEEIGDDAGKDFSARLTKSLKPGATTRKIERDDIMRSEIVAKAEASAKLYLYSFVKLGSTLVAALEEAIQVGPSDPSIAVPVAQLQALAATLDLAEAEAEAGSVVNQVESSSQASRPAAEVSIPRFVSGATALKQFKRDLQWVQERHSNLVSAVRRVLREARYDGSISK